MREKKKSEEDSASSTTSDSTTDGLVEVSGSLRKKARRERAQCVCDGADETEREIVARLMQWPSVVHGQSDPPIDNVKRVIIEKLLRRCGTVTSKLLGVDGRFEWKPTAAEVRYPYSHQRRGQLVRLM